MGSIVQYSVNIAMESILILMIAILFATCLWQRKVFPTTRPLIFMSSFIFFLLINQIVTWGFLIQDVPVKYGAMPMRIVYVLDYTLFYCISVAFYNYVEELVKEECRSAGCVYKPKKNIKIIMIVWGIGASLLYAGSLFVPNIFRIEEGVDIYSSLAYVFMHISIEFAFVCAIILLFRYQKVIGKHEALLSLCFIIFASLFSVVDELCGLCISYVLITLFTFILYVRIDLHKGLLVERQDKEIVEMKTQIMLSQMQPHFLYNVFTTISSMCEMQNATQARDVVNKFADYFRNNIDSLGKEKTISFEKELEHIKTYLWLEKVRFEDEINICYEIGPTDFAIPSLSVQPMVENAVKHGILPKEDGGTVTIRTYETPNDYVIVVKDDGVGFNVEERLNDSRSHIGIENVRRRLEMICNGSCEIQSKIGQGTVVTIHIPKGGQL